MAIAVRGGSVAGVIFHTDQGGEYTGELFAQACGRWGRAVDGAHRSALDNAVAESFNSTLEWELLRNNHFRLVDRPSRDRWLDRRLQQRPQAFHRRHAQPDRLRTRLRSTTQHRVRQRSGGGMNHNGGGFAAADLPGERRAGYGPPLRPQGRYRDRCATGPAARPYPEPLRPLTAQWQGQGQSPSRDRRRSRPSPTKQSLYGFPHPPNCQRRCTSAIRTRPGSAAPTKTPTDLRGSRSRKAAASAATPKPTSKASKTASTGDPGQPWISILPPTASPLSFNKPPDVALTA